MSNGIERLVQFTLGDEDFDISYIQESLSKLPLKDDEADESASSSAPRSFDSSQPYFYPSTSPSASLSSYWASNLNDSPPSSVSPLSTSPNAPQMIPTSNATYPNGYPIPNVGYPVRPSRDHFGHSDEHPQQSPFTLNGHHMNSQQHQLQQLQQLQQLHQLHQFQQQQQQQQLQYPAQFLPGSQGGHSAQSHSFRPYKSVPPPGYVCKLCKVPGHWIQSCPDAALYPLVRDFNNPHRKVTYPPEGYVCRLCGIPGHWIQNCPDAPKYPRPFDAYSSKQGNTYRGSYSAAAANSWEPEKVASDRRSLELSDEEAQQSGAVGATSQPSELDSQDQSKPGSFPLEVQAQTAEESSTLWMGDLENWMTEDVLTQYFSQFGEPARVRIATFKYGIPAGYCYIYYSQPKTAQKVFQVLNGQLMEGTNHVFRLKIANKSSRFFSRSHTKEQRPAATGGGGQKFDQASQSSPELPVAEAPFPQFSRSAGVKEAAIVESDPPQANFQYPFDDTTYDDHIQYDDEAYQDFSVRGPKGPSFSVFVGNLGLEIDRDSLLSVFQKRYPSVIGGKVVFDPFTGISKGYGFVIFSEEADQIRALKEMQGELCGDRPMRINRAVRRS